ncbi:phosphatidylinositol-binding protein scs2 [Cladophialophora chaetospira]|uniref:Phosphatidylinositol-binding protein scs2 n=1 Tax=Cladophialophora chaetospira TaxID=386627 RepID=A0AA38XG78_9EURO|nr:phosphatidylinositol-binding protein scs2 [Cladophialophora chaetospira]
MSVELLPAELGFRRPFNREVTETLKLTNGNTQPVAFKVKTTAPKQYCVRPNSGMIQPNDSVEVQVLLQAMKDEPPLDAKCRDKFLVQSVLTSADQDPNVTTLWQTVEKTAKNTIQERKIRVNFLPAAASTPNGVSTSHDEQPPAYSSPSPQFDTPARAPSNAASTTETAKSTFVNAAEATGVTAAASYVAASVPKSSDDIQEQLAAAKAQIQKLTSQLQDPQFRQRKVQEANEKVQTVVAQSQESGVPLQIVAGLCLLSFLIAYLFF